MRQHFKGVVWGGRTAENEGQTLHKYVVVGVLVTDKQIPELENTPPVKSDEDVPVKSQVVIDSGCPGFAEILKALPKRNAKRKVGEATDILLTLGEI